MGALKSINVSHVYILYHLYITIATVCGLFYLLLSILIINEFFLAFNTKFEEYEGNKVTSVHSMEEWKLLLKQNEDKLIVVDFYATWCPPCRRASPIYGKISSGWKHLSLCNKILMHMHKIIFLFINYYRVFRCCISKSRCRRGRRYCEGAFS